VDIGKRTGLSGHGEDDLSRAGKGVTAVAGEHVVDDKDVVLLPRARGSQISYDAADVVEIICPDLAAIGEAYVQAEARFFRGRQVFSIEFIAENTGVEAVGLVEPHLLAGFRMDGGRGTDLIQRKASVIVPAEFDAAFLAIFLDHRTILSFERRLP